MRGEREGTEDAAMDKAKQDLKVIEAVLGMIREHAEELVELAARGEGGERFLADIKRDLLEIVGCEELEDGTLG
jgi:hypothetical protein